MSGYSSDEISDNGYDAPPAGGGYGSDEYEDVAAARRVSRRRSQSASAARVGSQGAPGERHYTAAKRKMLGSMRRGGQATRRGASHAGASGVGSKYEVFFGLKHHTPGRLLASDLLLVAKTGKVVSARKYANGVKRYKAQMRDPEFRKDWNNNKR